MLINDFTKCIAQAQNPDSRGGADDNDFTGCCYRGIASLFFSFMTVHFQECIHQEKIPSKRWIYFTVGPCQCHTGGLSSQCRDEQQLLFFLCAGDDWLSSGHPSVHSNTLLSSQAHKSLPGIFCPASSKSQQRDFLVLDYGPLHDRFR